MSYPSTVSLSTTTLRRVARLVREHRRRIGSRWRRLCPSRQALLVLAHLRNGDTYARLAAGFRVGVATVYRYVREVVDLLAAGAPSMVAAAWRLAWSRNNYAILDGTVIRTNRLIANRPFYSGKHRHHGVNLQGLTDPYGNLLWISDGLPGAVNDTAAARTHHIPDICAQAGILLLADSGYDHVAAGVHTPYKGRKHLTPPYLQANRTHAAARCRGERGFAVLKSWHIFDRVRACPYRITALAKAVLALEHANQPG